MDKLNSHPWKGNVRELMNVVERAVMHSEGDTITEEDLPDFFHEIECQDETGTKESTPPATKVTNDQIIYWMKKTNNNKSEVARRLGVSYRTILRRCKDLDL